MSVHKGSEVWAGSCAQMHEALEDIANPLEMTVRWRSEDNPINWGFWLGQEMTLEEGVSCLSKLMKELSTHENIDPQQLQYKLMQALTGQAG